MRKLEDSYNKYSDFHMNYRVEIDGLRAVAVLAVLIYHLRAEWLPGGFIGVDIFFVISGFLITGIIRMQIKDKSFSYFYFYIKRIRRIAPVLLFITICVVFAGSFILKPGELTSLYESAWVQPLALQNMYYLMDGEYFHGADRKPLLHTWSLGVEEQFYLIWPLFIIMISRLQKRLAVIIVTGVIVASYSISILLLPISPKASFFLFPARAWELAAGGLLAVVFEKRGINNIPRWLKEAIASVGLLLLCVGFFWISKEVPYPGWHAIIPVVGTVALILASKGTGVGWLLSARPVVGIGLISYSLYLWHWPVMVFARMLEFDLENIGNIVLIFALIFMLAFFSYELVEERFRKRYIFKDNKDLVSCFAGVSLFIILVSFFAIKTQGFAFRYAEPARSMLTARFDADGDGRCGFVFRVLNPKEAICHTNKIDIDSGQGVLLWGNSHAAMWLGVVNYLGNQYGRPVFLNARNCRPTADSSFCGEEVQSAVLRSINANNISDVILANTWHGGYSVEDAVFEAELTAVVKRLVELGLNVWLVVDVPSGDKFNPLSQYEKSPNNPEIGAYSYSIFESIFQREKKLFGEIGARSEKIKILDPTTAVCPQRIECLGGGDNVVWYRDGNHLTSAGAFTARDVFKPVFTGGH